MFDLQTSDDLQTGESRRRSRRPSCLVAMLLAALAVPALAAEKPSYDIEDVKACSPDAMRLCKDRLPDLEAIQVCMKENYARLRPACKARFDHR